MQKRFTPDAGGAFPEWEEKTLGECMTLIASKGYKGKDLVNDEDKAIMFSPSDIDTFGVVSLVKNAHISDELFKKSKEALVKNGDVLFTKTASIGKVGYVKNLDHNATINPQLVILRANEDVDSYFLFCAVRTEAFKKQVRKISGGTTIKTMSQEALKELKIKIPKSIEEQRKIAAALAAYDEMIAVKTAKLETWQECKKRMVKEIFGRTKRFRDDDGNEFPEWEEKTLGTIVSITTGKLNANEMVDGGQFDFYTSGVDVFKIDKAAFNGPAITVAGNGANVGCLHLADGKFNAYQRTYVLQDFLACREYIYAAIEVKLPNVIKKYKRGSAIPYIVIDMLADLKIPLPCMEEQQKIGSFLAEIDKEIQIQKEFIKTYAEGKKRMMRELME